MGLGWPREPSTCQIDLKVSTTPKQLAQRDTIIYVALFAHKQHQQQPEKDTITILFLGG